MLFIACCVALLCRIKFINQKENLMSLKKFLAHLWEAIKSIFENVEDEVKKLLPVAIGIVNNIKLVTDNSTVDGLIHSLFPEGIAIDVYNKVKEYLPKLLSEMEIANDCAQLSRADEIAKCVLSKINLSSQDVKDIFYHGLAAKIIELLGDGKFTWGDSVAVVQWYYENEPK